MPQPKEPSPFPVRKNPELPRPSSVKRPVKLETGQVVYVSVIGGKKFIDANLLTDPDSQPDSGFSSTAERLRRSILPDNPQKP